MVELLRERKARTFFVNIRLSLVLRSGSCGQRKLCAALPCKQGEQAISRLDPSLPQLYGRNFFLLFARKELSRGGEKMLCLFIWW
jgi:hypothetical protein